MRLACPLVCTERFEVSQDDPDSTLDDVRAHMESPRHGLSRDASMEALAHVQVVDESLPDLG